MCDSCSMTICALERRGRHHAQRNLPRQIIQTSDRWTLIPCTVKVVKGRKARVKVKTKVTDPDTTAKAKVNSQSNSDTLMGIAISVVNTDTRNQTMWIRTISSMARVSSVEHMHERVDCLVKTVAHLESESVVEPNEEPAGIESLEWLYTLEHDGETMASLTDALVRLLLDSGSGRSACSLEFAPHLKTLTGSSVRARSATGQVTKSLGKKTVNFDINRIAAGANIEVLKISKPIVSAGKMVRSGRSIVLDEHDSFNEDKKTGKRILVELTRGDVFEISSYMSPNSHCLPKQPVLICPTKLRRQRILGTRSWMSRCQSLTLCQEEWRFLKLRQTKIVKHTNSHISPRSRGAACVFEPKGVDERHLRRPAGERAEAQGVDHLPVIQYDYAYLSSVNEKGGASENAYDSGYEHGFWNSLCD